MYNPEQERNLRQNWVVMYRRFACWLNAFVSLFGGLQQNNLLHKQLFKTQQNNLT